MPLIVLHNKWFLIVEVISQAFSELVLITFKVKRFTVWYKDVTTDEARLEELVGDEVPLGPIEVDAEKGESMLQSELFGAVLM